MRRSKEDAEQTRNAILDAAEQEFCTFGVASTTLERIARKAGVTRGAVYWHFDGKAEVMRGIRERYRLPQHDLIEKAATEGHPDPLALLEQSACEIMRAFAEDEGRQNMFNMLKGPQPDSETVAWLQQCNKDMGCVLLRLMQQAHKNGQLAADIDPSDATIFAMALLNGVLTEWLRSGKGFDLSVVGPRIFAFQTRSLRGMDVRRPVEVE